MKKLFKVVWIRLNKIILVVLYVVEKNMKLMNAKLRKCSEEEDS